MTKASLSGVWSGAFRYPRGDMPETVFSAHIEEVGGAFTGDIQEPNALHPHLGPVISSNIEGVRTGHTVAFTKFYDGSGGQAHAVRYEGSANEMLTRIEGRWSIPNNWSGTFFMMRDDDGAADEIEETAEELIEQRK
jgi:hypothetical protein